MYKGEPVPWQVQVLMMRVSDGRWIWTTPTRDMQMIGLAGEDCVYWESFGRNVKIPGEMATPRAETRHYAYIVELAVTGLGERHDAMMWFFADPGVYLLGCEVSDEMVSGALAVIVWSKALVQIGVPDGNHTWAFADMSSEPDKADRKE